MKGKGLAVGWVAMVLVVVAALGFTVAGTISLSGLGATAATQRAGLVRELGASRERTEAELAANVDLLRDFRWSPDGATAGGVLRRLADLARGGQAKVLAIAPVEQESEGRFRKSSHRVDMTASFRELVDFATRAEREGGSLEDVVIEVQSKSGEQVGPDAVRAQFRLTTIDPSEDTRRIMERILAISAKSSKSGLTAGLTLPIETRAEATPPLRDPFRYAEAPRRHVSARVVKAESSAPVSVKGIVKFPGGVRAIVNDQIVGVGDVVDGRRVEEIVDGRIVISEPGGGSRSVRLPGFTAPTTTRR